MYWEDVYDLYEYAFNSDIIEKNERMHYEFMLHAGSKEALDSWEDLKIPFPERDWKEGEHRAMPSYPEWAKVKTVKADEATKKRFKEISERIANTQKEAEKRNREIAEGKRSPLNLDKIKHGG